MKSPLLPIFFLLFAWSCGNSKVPSSCISSNGHFQAVVEIPAGSTKIVAYDIHSNKFIEDEKKQLPFLPFPGNYGFIPGTEHTVKDNGQGQAIDALVLCGTEPEGSTIEIEPIALLKLQRNGKEENKLIAVPVDTLKNTLDVKNYFEFQRDHYLCKNILMEWFLHVYQTDTIIFIGWGNEKDAKAEIEKRRVY